MKNKALIVGVVLTLAFLIVMAVIATWFYTEAHEDKSATARDEVTHPAVIASFVKGDIRFEVVGAFVGYVPKTSLFGRSSLSKDKLLRLTIRVSNLSKTKKFEYGTILARVGDDLGNEYKREFFVDVSDGKGSIYPGTSVIDEFVFQTPVPMAKRLVFTSDLRHAEDDWGVNLVIPMEHVRWR